MDNEIWKPYPEFPFIEGSSWGRVRTLDRVVSTKKGMRVVKGRILKQRRNRDGYLYMHFKVNGKTVNLSVHRLVAQTFIPNPDNLPELNHKDNNPLNNKPNNLEWCTHAYNIAYKEKYGTSAATALGCPVYAVNLKTWEAQWFKTQAEAGRELGVTNQHINNIIKGRQNHAHGYWFTNADNNAVEVTKQKFGSEVADKVKDLMNELQPA